MPYLTLWMDTLGATRFSLQKMMSIGLLLDAQDHWGLMNAVRPKTI